MEYETFKNKMREKLQERMGAKGEVKVIQLKENNGGLRDELAYVVNDNNLTPGLWLEEIYKLYKEYIDKLSAQFNKSVWKQIDMETIPSVKKADFFGIYENLTATN